ncbi:Spindle pole body protein [Abeliophyllum distichum]|uniref:Spindle pole body protein n=1 Tax=Abeliophyllum distichum TaxID=126358 RepID=A0ABD1V774_9LAMI
MKKSKFLQNSKDMLSKSFNPAKCKTSLKLAASRLKLLRNKKEVQVKQMKRELAQLLESGNIQTARIRVEHVIREEKMMAAFDLIAIYCELTVARMPIIESQKNCPIDLKEAITSLVFASPRCGDVPELLDVRKHFTAKYGKDFTTAAIELRPDCGVSRMLVEKLSAMAPDGQTKIKILSAIAEEHNVKWDPNSFGEKDSTPSNDLLNGPSTFEKNSKMYAEPPRFEAPHSQSPPVDYKMHSSSMKFSEQDPRSSLGTQNTTSSLSSSVSSTFQSEMRPPLRDERVQSIHEDGNAFSKQRWNMEFKDATSAAQAAAESAELASMAARAAAELSSHGRIMRQYSTESHNSDVHNSKHNRPGSQLRGENFPDYSANLSSGHSRLQNDDVDQVGHNNLETAAGRLSEDGYGSTKGFSQSASLRSKTSINDSLDHDVQGVEGYSRKIPLKEEANKDEMNMKKTNEGEVGMKKQSVYDTESANGWQEKSENFPEERLRKQPSHISSHPHSSNSSDKNIFAKSEQEQSVYDAHSANGWQEKSENFPEERIRKPPSHISSHSHSSTFGDENIFANSEHQNFGYDAGKDPMVGIGKGRIDEDASQTSPHDLTSAVFDKSDSDSDDEYGFNMGRSYDDPVAEVNFPSPGKKSPKYSPIKPDAWNPKTSSIKLVENSTSSLFHTEKHKSPEFSDNFVPVTFDDSDGPDSDSDEHMNTFDPHGTKVSINLPSRQNTSPQSVGSSFKERGYSEFDRKQSPFSYDEVKSEELHGENNQGTKFDAESPKMFSSRKSFANPPSPGPEKVQLESNDTGSELSSESGKGLNFGMLTGGFRHKGNNPPPFLKSRLDDPISLKKTAEETVSEAAASPTVESSRLSTTLDDKKSMRGRYPHPDMDTDSSGEELSQKETSGRGRESYIHSAGNTVQKKSSLGAPVSVFGSANSDLDEDIPKQSRNRKSHLPSGVSEAAASPTVESSRLSTTLDDKKSMRGRYPHPDMDTDSSGEELSQKETSGRGRESYIHSAGNTVQKKSSLGAPVSVFGSDNSDLDEDIPKQSRNRKSHLPSGISRRTKTSNPKTRLHSDSGFERKPSTSNSTETPQESRSQTRNSDKRENPEQPTTKASSPKTRLDSESGFERKPSTSNSTGTPQESRSQTRISDKRENPEQPNSAKAASKPMNSSFSRAYERPTQEKPAYATVQESKISRKSSDIEQQSSPQPKKEALESSENPKPTSSKTSSNKENSATKASHVHPKLPDYDTIAAQLQSLRQKR